MEMKEEAIKELTESKIREIAKETGVNEISFGDFESNGSKTIKVRPGKRYLLYDNFAKIVVPFSDYGYFLNGLGIYTDEIILYFKRQE